MIDLQIVFMKFFYIKYYLWSVHTYYLFTQVVFVNVNNYDRFIIMIYTCPIV
jgi:hypothetical protein